VKAENRIWATAALVVLSLLMAVPARPDVFLYYNHGSDPCYSADFAYSRYSVRFDPADFGVGGRFAIVKVFGNATIPAGLSIPLTISDVSPAVNPDSVWTRQLVTFTPGAWDTFDIAVERTWDTPFWVTFDYPARFVPFLLSDPAEWDGDRNLVETGLGWGAISCDMAVGVVVETPSGIESSPARVPVGLRLEPNRPNPFNPSTTISFSIDRRGPVELTVFDVRGRRVDTLVDRPLDPGRHQVVWRGDGRLPTGVYFYQLRAGAAVVRRKMVLSK